MWILIVDDNVFMCKVLVVFFVGVGYEVVGVFVDGNGIEEMIWQMIFEFVCLDYYLLGCDGLVLLKVIQVEVLYIDVVFMMVFSEFGIEEKVVDVGVLGFICKLFG